LNQTYPPLEIIVVDDGSTDNSAEIAESFGPPVRVFRQENRGESVARNVAIREARGDYIALLDADDLLHPESHQRLTEAVRDAPGGVACMGCSSFTTNHEEPHSVTFPSTDAFFPGILRGNFGAPHCWLAPKTAIDAAGGFCNELTYFEDWDLWWRVGLTGAKFVPVEFAGALYRQHPDSQMATAKQSDRSLGHAVIKQRMGAALLEHTDLLAEHGDTLFWVCWSALNQARSEGVAWSELRPLCNVIAEIVRKGPKSVRQNRTARIVSQVGIRWACRVHSMVGLGTK
jgi:GT2 family glycosyltransferase